MSKKARGNLGARRPKQAWARNGLSKIIYSHRHNEQDMYHSGIHDTEPDPRRQTSWNNFFAKVEPSFSRRDDELRFDGAIKPFSPFA
jgi:hypothetical protein